MSDLAASATNTSSHSSNTTDPDERRQWRMVGLVGVLSLVMGSALLWGFSRRANVFMGGQALPVLGQVTDFQLTERSGQEVQLASLRGKVWVADFIFTYCAGPCPRMTQQMAVLQRDWAKENGMRLVSVSVDPQRDTTTRLQEYATQHDALPERWLFLTGEMACIQKLAVEGFKLGSVEDPILHSTKFALVDRVGNIRGYYEGTSDDEVAQLSRDIRRVLSERAW